MTSNSEYGYRIKQDRGFGYGERIPVKKYRDNMFNKAYDEPKPVIQSPVFGGSQETTTFSRPNKSSHARDALLSNEFNLAQNDSAKMLNSRQYLSHSPQPYLKSKLQPPDRLMVYGQNNKPLHYNPTSGQGLGSGLRQGPLAMGELNSFGAD